MAKLAVTVTVFLFLFSSSFARMPLNFDGKSVLRLPSEEIAANSESQSLPAESELPAPDRTRASATPISTVKFRPINRHFHLRSGYPVVRCRHVHQRHSVFRYDPIMRYRMGGIPYDNDMIVSSGENGDFEEPLFSRSAAAPRRFPGRWMRLRHHHRDDPNSASKDTDEKGVKNVAVKRYDYDRFDREKNLRKLKFLKQHYRQEKEVKKDQVSFVKGVRKFLNSYF